MLGSKQLLLEIYTDEKGRKAAFLRSDRSFYMVVGEGRASKLTFQASLALESRRLIDGLKDLGTKIYEGTS